MRETTMKIAIVGAGAVGGVVAWHLARTGAEPVIVARPASAASLSRHGLTVTGPSGTETARVAATADPVALGACDLVLAGFKAHDWPAALPLVCPLIGPDTILVPMLNGIPWWYFQGLPGQRGGERVAAVDPEGALASAIPARSILGCVVYTGASRQVPHHVVWNGVKRFVLGEPAGGMSERLRGVAALLASSGLDAEATPDIRRAVWHKVIGNATHNPLSVVTGATMGHLETAPHLNAIRRRIMAEVVAVAAALGVGGFDVEERLKLTPALRGFRTSMLQDYEEGRPLELGAIVDAVVELGSAAGVPTPVLATVGALALERWRGRHGSEPEAPPPPP
jgi:2-dehydropantoate 2-reductase